MSNRLASFRGPSIPSSSPVQLKQPHPTPLSHPSRQTETTYHRKTRSLLQELRSIARTWDELIVIDGLKTAKSLVDARTDLDNELAAIPDKQPQSVLVSPKLQLMDQCLADLDVVVLKLQKQFSRMNVTIDHMESVFFEAHQAKGTQWTHQEPLWVTWPLERFVASIPSILVPYHRSLRFHTELVNALRSNTLSFTDSRALISQWVTQPCLQEEGWSASWEDICAVEIEHWEK